MGKPVQAVNPGDRCRKRGVAGRRSPATALLMAVFLVCGAPRGAVLAQEGASVEQSEADLKAVRERWKKLARQVERERGRKTAAAEAVEKLERRIADTQAELAALDSELAASQRRLAETEARHAEAAQAVEAERVRLARQLRAAYVAGRLPRASLLLSQNEASGIGRLQVYFDYFARARAARIEASQRQLAEIAALGEQLRGQSAELAALREHQVATLVSLEASKSDRARAVQRLDAAIASGGRELKSLEAEQRDLNALLESLHEAFAGVPTDFGKLNAPIVDLRGRLPWPVNGATLAHFGQPKAGGRLAWSGQWIAADAGAPVIAVARGRIAYVGWLHRYGLIVIVEHDGGYYTLYGHNQSVEVAVGDAVKPGQVIAKAGNTGGHGQTGVYFELRSGAQAIDPRPWLLKVPSPAS